MKPLNIKNNSSYLVPVKLINLLDFSADKLSIGTGGAEDLCIFYIYYDKQSLFLVVANLKGFIEDSRENDGKKYLTLEFLSHYQKSMYLKVFDEIKKAIDNVVSSKNDDFAKDCSVIMFDDGDININDDGDISTIDIKSDTLIIRSVFKNDGCYYPHVTLNYCSYN